MAWSKESRKSRGYGPEWDKIRARIIRRDKGLCQMCLKAGRVTQGKAVDHIKPKAECAKLGWPKEKTDADVNLWYLCKPCHDRKTDEENGRAHQPRTAFGSDGWPLDKPD